ncbi:hypothetical protein TELCIR_07523 [Teladorsagia circumcincta]|uniref:phosphoethanolamine N-methyltransferase n=1 Tax=Teladorsagia circumcincta TaxID=45464 RepID=A0A2G9UK26_TELCI|nr:hypothetical protein TELCIR_07523 [Teladorsagia circumcincta]
MARFGGGVDISVNRSDILGRSKTVTMHSAVDANPTHYRFSSLYIKRLNNWRQVHWLTKKVPADGDEETSVEYLLKLFSQTWPAEQRAWDEKLDNEKYSWSDEKFTCNVWNVETGEYFYRTSLTKANNQKDQRVRFGWNESLSSSIDYWNQRDASFDCMVATELLSTNDDDSIKRITSIMTSEAKVVLLEPVDGADEESVRERLTACGFKNIDIADVTQESRNAEASFFTGHNLDVELSDCNYLLIKASL